MPVTEAIREEKNDAILEGKINLNKNYIKWKSKKAHIKYDGDNCAYTILIL